ncbi:MAG: hypothetical protein E6R13_02635 [Spirochaetes bacterium]|nr:MAG: hypothetical protein E6R13_02635 [Spirochaetota bacterium]
MDKVTLSPEQIAGAVDGYFGFIQGKTVEESQEAFSKQAPEVQEQIKANALKRVGFKPEETKEDDSFSFDFSKTNTNTPPATDDKSKGLDKEELFNSVLDRIREENKKEALEREISEASIRVKSFMQDSVAVEQQSDVATFIKRYVAGAVADGDNYKNATEEAIAMLESYNSAYKEIRGTGENIIQKNKNKTEKEIERENFYKDLGMEVPE